MLSLSAYKPTSWTRSHINQDLKLFATAAKLSIFFSDVYSLWNSSTTSTGLHIVSMPGQRLPQVIDGQFIHTHYGSVIEPEPEPSMTQYLPSDLSSSITPFVTSDSGDSNYAADANLGSHNAQEQQYIWAQQQQFQGDTRLFQWVSSGHCGSGPISGAGAQSLEAPHIVIQDRLQPQGRISDYGEPYTDIASQQGQQGSQASSHFVPSWQVWLSIVKALHAGLQSDGSFTHSSPPLPYTLIPMCLP